VHAHIKNWKCEFLADLLIVVYRILLDSEKLANQSPRRHSELMSELTDVEEESSLKAIIVDLNGHRLKCQYASTGKNDLGMIKWGI